MVERFSLNDRYFGRMPKYISANFNSEFQLDEMKDFFEKYPEAGAGKGFKILHPRQNSLSLLKFAGKRARKQALENVENNIAWLQRHKESIYKWLVENPTQ